MKHDNDNVPASDSQMTTQFREFCRRLADEVVAVFRHGRQPQPLLWPVKVLARARDRNRPPQRY